MSREERRNYERMMRNMERGPQLPPAAKARAERNAQRRAARASAASAPSVAGLRRRFIVVSTLIALAAGFIAFSLQWPNMPFALYVGAIVAVVALAVQVGLRVLRRRMAAR